MIDHATVEKIKNTADIVEVVSDYVHLIRRGANFMGLCPFHNERTPSFSVNKQRNFCYCFSCKKGGSPVHFIMEKEGLSYREALLHLAKKYGIEVVEKELTDEERARQSEREAMFVANEWAMRKMEKDLTDTEEGRDIGLQYLSQRGVTDEAMKAFHLGYAIDRGNELTDTAKRAGFDLDVLKSLGLVGISQHGREYDRFRGRIIFPILNTAGKVIAFGGRDLKGGLSKYINSPESNLYKKSNELYGIFQAKSSIVSEDKCFLVEGYMDVIGMWQSGMKNAVASSGTALTDGQIAMIHRFTDNITLIYDGDKAGIKAALRGIDMLLSHRLNVKVLLLPDNDDPDSFARKHTSAEFKDYVTAHETDIIRFKAKVLLDDVRNDPHNRIEAINSVVSSIAHIPDPVSRDVYVQECSLILGIPEATIAQSVAIARRSITEAQKRERTRREFPAQTAENSIPDTSSSEKAADDDPKPETSFSAGNMANPVNPSVNQAHPGATVKKTIRPEANPLYPLERNVLRYCLRYAFLKFYTYETEITSPETGLPEKELRSLDVLTYVSDELSEEKMSFSVDIFARIFSMLIEMRPAFDAYLASRMESVETELESARTEAYARIRQSSMSIEEISREEKKLESELSSRRESAVKEYTKEYPGRILGSDENEEVRRIALELVLEKHHLSNIYLKAGNMELEEDRLDVLLVRAIDEWKNEIINQSINELFRQFREISGKGNTEEEQRLQAELTSRMEMRTRLAKCIGERILFNGRNK
jgi:DNA primase